LRVRAVRGVVVVAAVFATLLGPVPAARAAAPTTTVPVQGLEYAASLTEGRFGGVARGEARGVWTAVVVHDPLSRGSAAPITGGSFTLHGRDRAVSGTFVDGSVTPSDAAGSCGDERFDVAGALALDGGGRGSFRVVLTHLRVRTDDGCRTYAASVVGSLRVPARAVTG
jgi:hypothetical protein